jgi:predicted ABC-type transport system involved in lysophospholipase L1 biosynthesis ATPase subunit
VIFCGEDLWALPETALADMRRQRLGFVFQFFSLLANLRAIDNVALPALLGREMAAADAYARAGKLLARVGLTERTAAYPGELSGGEQRRVAIARALINSPSLLLADEPTGDLDEDTENDIIALLQDLRREASFGLIVVTHNLSLASRADRVLQMRQGRLYAADLPEASVKAHPPRRFGPAPAPAPIPLATAVGAREVARLGQHLWAAAGRALVAAGTVFLVAAAANYGVARYQRHEAALRRERLAALEELATSTLKSEIDAIAGLGEGRYEVTIYLENAGDKPIYVMAPSLQAFIQVGSEWRELPLTPIVGGGASVLKIIGRELYRFSLDARVEKFTELLPHYMHVRFMNNMLVSPDSAPQNNLIQRNDNYYIYLKPDWIDDAAITKDIRFAGAPPLWIWMPPH